jgi:hypothetical protein
MVRLWPVRSDATRASRRVCQPAILPCRFRSSRVAALLAICLGMDRHDRAVGSMGRMKVRS